MSDERARFKRRFPSWNGAWCGRCDSAVYLVQAPSGERFYVSHDGRRYCA